MLASNLLRKRSRSAMSSGGNVRRMSKAARQNRLLTQRRLLRGVLAGQIRGSNQPLVSSGETKGVDTNLSTGLGDLTEATNSSTPIIALNLIQTGSGSWNRVGRKVFPQSVRLKYTIRYRYAQRASGEVQANNVRVLLVWDKNPNGAALPTFDTIFKATDQSGNEASYWNAPAAYDTMDRFRIIRDTVHDFNPAMYPATSGDIAFMSVSEDQFVVLPAGLETVYSGQAVPQTIADLYSGALYFVAIMKDALPTDYAMQILDGSVARLRYKD